VAVVAFPSTSTGCMVRMDMPPDRTWLLCLGLVGVPAHGEDSLEHVQLDSTPGTGVAKRDSLTAVADPRTVICSGTYYRGA
jgi:hypothetical protein